MVALASALEWNREAIDCVQITVSEKLGVGSRGGYYEEAGAIRDMVQNHMLQLLALIAMEPPARYDGTAIRVARSSERGTIQRR